MKRRTATLITLGVVLLLGCWFFFRDYQRIKSFPPTAWTEDTSADCAVVLTGGAGRVREGFDLLSQKAIRKLIISGVNPKAQLREMFPQRPFYPNVDEADVVLERRSTTTYGNIHQSLPLVEALKCKSVIVVTSHVHMYRAMRTFDAAKPEGLKLFSRAVVAGAPDNEDLLMETLKSVFYSLWAY